MVITIMLVTALVLFIVIGMAVGRRTQQSQADQYLQAMEELKTKRAELKSSRNPVISETVKPGPYREVLSTTTTQVAESTRITDESNFALSVAVAAATDSTILGAAIGGDLTGAVIGDMLNDSDEEHRSDHSYSNDSDDHSDTSDYSSSDDSSSDSSDYGSDSSSDSSSSDY